MKPALSPSVDIRIDPEFASLIPALSDDEFRQLLASILAEGCRDPLIVWQEENILLDGHNRLTICREHDRPFTVALRSFPSREAAREFILHTQLGRRNISLEAAGYLRGKRYLELRQQGKRSDLTSGQDDPKRLSEQLAQEYKVGEKTIRRDAIFADAVDRIAGNCGEDARKWILSRRLTLRRSGVVRVSRLPEEEQRKFIEEALKGEKRPRFPKTQATITLSRNPEELVQQLIRRLGRGEAATVAQLLAEAL